jgi:ATP-binding cassette, subfamily B, bacterial
MKDLLRLKRHVRPHSRQLALLTALAFAGVALEALLPWPLKLIIDHVFGATPLPPTLEWVAALPGGDGREGLLAWLACAVLALFLAAKLVGLARSVLQADVNSRLKWGLGAAVFAELQALSVAYHRRSRKGDLIHRVISDTDCLPTLVTGAVLPALTAIVSLIVFFTVMWQLDAMLAALSVLVVAPMLALMRALGPRMTERAYEQQETEGRVWSIAEQSLSSLPVVQAFGREEHEGRRFHSVAATTIRAALRNTVTQLQFKAGIDGSQAVGAALILFVGGLHAQQGALTVGSLVIFLSYLASLYAPLNTLAYLSSTIAAALGHAKRVVQVFDAGEKLPEPGAAAKAPSLARAR